MCHGGGFGNYTDNASFCAYVQNRWSYLEVECGMGVDVATLTIDSSLAATAQAAANAVASGGAPQGTKFVGGDFTFTYVNGCDANGDGYFTKNAMYTAPESSMQTTDTSSPDACQFSGGDDINGLLYHYCQWDNDQNFSGKLSTQPQHVGCGTAVDTNGVSWRVVQLGP